MAVSWFALIIIVAVVSFVLGSAIEQAKYKHGSYREYVFDDKEGDET